MTIHFWIKLEGLKPAQYVGVPIAKDGKPIGFIRKFMLRNDYDLGLFEAEIDEQLAATSSGLHVASEGSGTTN